MSTLGEKLRELRGASSQREMAEAVGIKWNAWARYEADGAAPGAEMLAKICRVHACSADWLLGLSKSAAKSAAHSAAQSAAQTAAQSAAVPGEMAACAKCPFKKAAENFQKILPQKVPRKVPRK